MVGLRLFWRGGLRNREQGAAPLWKTRRGVRRNYRATDVRVAGWKRKECKRIAEGLKPPDCRDWRAPSGSRPTSKHATGQTFRRFGMRLRCDPARPSKLRLRRVRREVRFSPTAFGNQTISTAAASASRPRPNLRDSRLCVPVSRRVCPYRVQSLLAKRSFAAPRKCLRRGTTTTIH